MRAGQPGERRAQEGVEVVAVSAEPLEAEEREQRAAESGLAETNAPLERVRDAQPAECRLERRADAVECRADEHDLLRRDPRAQQVEQLLGDELERAALPCAFEEADRALELRAGVGPLREEMAFEMGQRGRRDLAVAWRELLDPPRGERPEVVHRAAQRRERRAPRLIGKRDRDVGPARQRVEQCPLGAGQIFEPVREDRPPGPGLQLSADPVHRVTALEIAIPEAEAVELRAVGGVQTAEIAVELVRIDQPRLQLAQGTAERLRKAGEARRGAEPVQGCAGNDAADDQVPLRVGRNRTTRSAVARDPLEQVVKGADRAADERAARRQELALDPVDVRPVGHDEHRILVERGEVALEQQRDFSRVRGAGEDRKAHRPYRRPALGRRKSAPLLSPRQRLTQTSGVARGEPWRDRACRRRSRRRGRPAWPRDVHR